MTDIDFETSASAELNAGIINLQVYDSDGELRFSGPIKFEEDGDPYIKASYYVENDWPDQEDGDPHDGEAFGGFQLTLSQAERLADWLLEAVEQDAEVLFQRADT